MATEMEGKGQVEEIMVTTTVKMVEGSTNGGVVVEAHPYAFHVSGPRNLSSPNWRDIISSSWSVSLFIFSIFLTFLVDCLFSENVS